MVNKSIKYLINRNYIIGIIKLWYFDDLCNFFVYFYFSIQEDIIKTLL